MDYLAGNVQLVIAIFGTKTRGNKCHSFVDNKTRDAKRQKAIVKGKVL